ncbi:MAG: LysM peptidoglycan-binding domain-containing protein [Deltaproteobacteria bacterium]|nr:LysM peptidoglycan-binding domain-containing protein [Deltaproteobacteria bacterium]
MSALRGIATFAAIVAFSAGGAARVRADGDVFHHTVRPGETLASIAQRYYGDTNRELVLVLANGLVREGGSAIVVGLTLEIPTIRYHRVTENETWSGIAERYLGDPRRAEFLAQLNGSRPAMTPTVGAEIVIPYQLRYVAGANERLIDIAVRMLGGREHLQVLRRYNGLPRTAIRAGRGDILLIPVTDLVLSRDGRQLVAGARGQPEGDGRTRELQQRIDSEIPQLLGLVRRGRYVEAVALANRLLGQGSLNAVQVVTIHRELATAYVALEREDLAEQAFTAALAVDPNLQLDALRTSPRVLSALDRARARQRRR